MINKLFIRQPVDQNVQDIQIADATNKILYILYIL